MELLESDPTSPASLLVDALALLLLIPVGLLIWFLIRRMTRSATTVVHEDHTVRGDPAGWEHTALTAAAEAKRVTVAPVTAWHHVVLVKRSPIWAIVLAFALFPIGLFLLFVHEHLRLDVVVFVGAEGTVVRLTGSTERQVLERIRAVLTARSTPAEP
jgi:hypothetical protein